MGKMNNTLIFLCKEILSNVDLLINWCRLKVFKSKISFK